MKNKIIILSTILFILLLLLLLARYINFSSDSDVPIENIKSNDITYTEDLRNRLIERDKNFKLTNEQLNQQLEIIDEMYNDWLINATEDTYYKPLEWCSRETERCFSIRETYLFNFNF